MNEHVPIDELAKLAELRANGAIDDAEFKELKRKLLASIADNQPVEPTANLPSKKAHPFVEAIQGGFRKYAIFSGRASRAEFWYWMLFALVSNAVVTVIDLQLGTPFSINHMRVITTLFNLAIALPSYAVWVRRLHDCELSGWWVLIVLVLGVVAELVRDLHDGEMPFWGLGLDLAILVGMGINLTYLCSRGSDGDNKYGADPLAMPESTSEIRRNLSVP